MTDAGSQERTYPLSAAKLEHLLNLISSAGHEFIGSQPPHKPNHIESIPSDRQSPLEEI